MKNEKSGHSTNKIERGDHLIFNLSAKTLVVHRPSSASPVRWNSGDGERRIASLVTESDCLILASVLAETHGFALNILGHSRFELT